MTYEGLRLKILKIIRVKLSKHRLKDLKNDSFTIISNNCWGGMIYESYGLVKQSPTVGLFFMADDYIRFIKELKKNISCELQFIPPEKSKWFNQMKNTPKYGEYPIGIIGENIEIFFLHYKTEEEAKEKWDRRCKRINWSRLIIKFNDQNNCSSKNVREFQALKYPNKLFFTVKEWEISDKKDVIKIHQLSKKDFIQTSYEPFGKSPYIDITSYINQIKTDYSTS